LRVVSFARWSNAPSAGWPANSERVIVAWAASKSSS
jgi:hypothetical protein